MDLEGMMVALAMTSAFEVREDKTVPGIVIGVSGK